MPPAPSMPLPPKPLPKKAMTGPAPMPKLAPMPDLPKTPGFSAFGYETPDLSKIEKPETKKECKPCNEIPEIIVIDKKDLPAPKVKIINEAQTDAVAMFAAQTESVDEFEGFEEEFLAQLDHFAY